MSYILLVNEWVQEQSEWMDKSVRKCRGQIDPIQIHILLKNGQCDACHFLRWIFWRGGNPWHQIYPLSLQSEFGCYSSFLEAWDSIFCQGRRRVGWNIGVANGKAGVAHHRRNSFWKACPSCRCRQGWETSDLLPPQEWFQHLGQVSVFSKIACVRHCLNKHCIK